MPPNSPLKRPPCLSAQRRLNACTTTLGSLVGLVLVACGGGSANSVATALELQVMYLAITNGTEMPFGAAAVLLNP